MCRAVDCVELVVAGPHVYRDELVQHMNLGDKVGDNRLCGESLEEAMTSPKKT